MSRIFNDPSSKPNNNKLNRVTSCDSTGATVDPLRLVKVNSNPLVKQAEKTLELLEKQSEWKKERWKELSEGLNDQSPNEDWQSSLTRWKTRRRSDPLYSQRSLQLSQTSSVVYDETDNDGGQLQSPVTSPTAFQTNRPRPHDSWRSVDVESVSKGRRLRCNGTTDDCVVAAEVSEPSKTPPRVAVRRAQQSFNDYTPCHQDDTPQHQSVEDVPGYDHPVRHGALSSYEVQLPTRDTISDVKSSTVSPPSGVVMNTNLTDDNRKIEERGTPQHCQDKMTTAENFNRTDWEKSQQSENFQNGLTSTTADVRERATSNTFQKLESLTEQKTLLPDNSSAKKPPLVSHGDRTVVNGHSTRSIQKKSDHEDNTYCKVDTVTSTNNGSKHFLADMGPPSKSPAAHTSPASAAATANDVNDVDVPPPLPSARPPPLHWTMYTSRDNDEFEDDDNFETVPVTSSTLSANPTDGRDNVPKIVSASVNESDRVLSSSSSVTVTMPTAARASKTDQSEMIPSRIGREIKKVEKTLDSSHEVTTSSSQTSTSQQGVLTSAKAPCDDVTVKNHNNGVADDTRRTDVTRAPTAANINDQNRSPSSSSRQETVADQLHASSIANKALPDQLQTTASVRITSGTEVTASNSTAAGGGQLNSLTSVRRNSGALFRLNASPKPKFIDSTAWIGRQQKTK